MKISTLAVDTIPGIVAAGTDIIPNLNPYLQAVILLISGITALIRLINFKKNPPKTP